MQARKLALVSSYSLLQHKETTNTKPSCFILFISYIRIVQCIDPVNLRVDHPSTAMIDALDIEWITLVYVWFEYIQIQISISICSKQFIYINLLSYTLLQDGICLSIRCKVLQHVLSTRWKHTNYRSKYDENVYIYQSNSSVSPIHPLPIISATISILVCWNGYDSRAEHEKIWTVFTEHVRFSWFSVLVTSELPFWSGVICSSTFFSQVSSYLARRAKKKIGVFSLSSKR